MEDDFEDEVLSFMIKAVIVSGCVFALWPSLARTFSPIQAAAPLSGRLYLDPDSGNYWVYVPEEEN